MNTDNIEVVDRLQKFKEDGISKILEEANGSWKDLIEDGFNLGIKWQNQQHSQDIPTASDSDLCDFASSISQQAIRNKQSLQTWQQIFDLYAKEGTKTPSEWLEENYYPPVKK